MEAYLLNSMDESELAAVEEHLLYCAGCQDRCDGMDRYLRAMKTAAERVEKDSIKVNPISARWNWIPSWFNAPMPVWVVSFTLLAILLTLGVRTYRGTETHAKSAVDVELMAIRGTLSSKVPAGHALHLILDNRDLPEVPAYPIEIVDLTGSRVWTGTGTWSATAITANVPIPFSPGTYYIRLLKNGDENLREFQLVVE